MIGLPSKGVSAAVSDYSHRDRRAHREVGRALWTVVGVSLGLTAVAVVLPWPFVGIASVVAMGALGLAYLGWSDRMLDRYASDLRRARDGTSTDGFVRVEVATPVGLYRDARLPTSPSPHTRRRARSGPAEMPIGDRASGTDRDQL